MAQIYVTKDGRRIELGKPEDTFEAPIDKAQVQKLGEAAEAVRASRLLQKTHKED